jgi:hypothetical protein
MKTATLWTPEYWRQHWMDLAAARARRAAWLNDVRKKAA